MGPSQNNRHAYRERFCVLNGSGACKVHFIPTYECKIINGSWWSDKLPVAQKGCVSRRVSSSSPSRSSVTHPTTMHTSVKKSAKLSHVKGSTLSLIQGRFVIRWGHCKEVMAWKRTNHPNISSIGAAGSSDFCIVVPLISPFTSSRSPIENRLRH